MHGGRGRALPMRLASLMMGLWRSMALPPPRWMDGGDEDEASSMVRRMAVEDWDAQKISIPFIFGD